MDGKIGRALAVVLVLTAMATSARADLVIQYSHQSRNSSFSLTYSSGSSYDYGFYGGFGRSCGWGGSTIYSINGGSFLAYDGYLFPGAYYPSPYVAWGGAALDPLGLSASPRRERTRDYTPLDAERLRQKYYGVDGKDSMIPGGDADGVAARLARTESVRLGLRAFRDGRYAEAMLLLREAYLRDTRDPGVKIFFGISLIPLGEYEAAAKALRRGIEDSAPGSAWLVEVPKLYGNPKDLAAHQLLLAKRKDQGNPLTAAFVLAYVLASEGQFAEAKRYLDLLGAQDGKATEALRGLVQARLGN